MRKSRFKLVGIISLSSLLLVSCKNSEENNTLSTEKEIDFCNCLELSLDEAYNHFYLEDRTQPYTGKCELTNEKGIVILKKTFNKGKLEGPYIEYYENGQVMNEWNFLENRQHGDQKIFDESGNLIHHSKHNKGDLDTIYLKKTN